jgi:hypothetical protein
MPRPIDRVGQVFGRLTVLRMATQTKDNKSRWEVECSCGVRKIVRASVLANGSCTSCGCYQIEYTRARSITHGMTSSREYNSWHAMKLRCTNPHDHNYPQYGGRGITVSSRWIDSFETFFSDLGPRPVGTTIDRIDPDGNYEPGNVRWASIETQNRNKRSNQHLTDSNGVTKLAADWARDLGISQTTINNRIARGWSEADAVSTPAKVKK